MQKVFLILICFIISCLFLCSCSNINNSSNKNIQTNKTDVPILMVSDKFVYSLENQLKEINNKNNIKDKTKVYYTKSLDYNSVYFFGTIIENNGQLYPCIWATNDISFFGAGLVFSVNDYALELSLIGDGRTNKEPITSNNDGYNRISKKLVDDMMQYIQRSNK